MDKGKLEHYTDFFPGLHCHPRIRVMPGKRYSKQRINGGRREKRLK